MGVAYTKKLSEVAHAYETIVKNVATSLGIQDVWYGNQVKFPRTPCVVVEPDDKTSVLRNSPRGTLNTFRVVILIIHMKVQDSQITRSEADTLAEAVEAEINKAQFKTLPNAAGDALVVHQFVGRVESGFVNRENSNYMSTRLTAEAENLTQLPY
jgi:hypothetical protein